MKLKSEGDFLNSGVREPSGGVQGHPAERHIGPVKLGQASESNRIDPRFERQTLSCEQERTTEIGLRDDDHIAYLHRNSERLTGED